MTWSEFWDYARDLGPTVALLVSAVGLGLNGVGLLRTARITRNTFMLHFYDRLQKFNPIHLYLKEGWPHGAQGPTSPEEWNEVSRYMGLLEGLWRVMQDKAYPYDRADSDYSHRILAIVLNPAIRHRFLDENSDEVGAWGDFIKLWRCLESGAVYRTLVAELLREKGVVVPRAPRPLTSRRRSHDRRATRKDSAMAISRSKVKVGGEDLDFLDRRGASADGSADFTHSAVLKRSLAGLRLILEHADPRRRLPPAVCDAAIAALSEPWELEQPDIERLESVLARSAGLGPALAVHGLDQAAFLAAIAGLSFAEKFALVDLATQAWVAVAAEINPEHR